MTKKVRKYEEFLVGGREEFLKRVEEGYRIFQETRTYAYPTWQYGEPKGKLFKVEVEDSPRFGETAYVELDSARTAFVAIDMQTVFAAKMVMLM